MLGIVVEKTMKCTCLNLVDAGAFPDLISEKSLQVCISITIEWPVMRVLHAENMTAGRVVVAIFE